MRSCNNYSLFKARIYVFLIIVYARSYSHRTDASRSGVGCVYVGLVIMFTGFNISMFTCLRVGIAEKLPIQGKREL